MGFFKRLFEGNKKTKRSFAEKLKYIFTGNEIDEEFYEELEYCLISSDIGATTCEEILDELRAQVKLKKLKKTEDCKDLLKDICVEILEKNPVEEFISPAVLRASTALEKPRRLVRLLMRTQSKVKRSSLRRQTPFARRRATNLKCGRTALRLKLLSLARGQTQVRLFLTRLRRPRQRAVTC